MVTTVVPLTAVVVIVNEGDFSAPADTSREAGTAATAELELVNVTRIPPGGAGALRDTTLVDLAGGTPPVTSTGARLMPASATGFTVTVAVAVDVPYVAVMTTWAGALTRPAVMVNGTDETA